MHALRPLEHRLLDRFVRAQAAKLVPDPDIVLVDIDEKSLARMEKDAGRWPWPRVVHAELVEGLAAQKPRAIVFDIAFTEADSFRRQDDAAFAETDAKHANTYFPLLKLPMKNDAAARIGRGARMRRDYSAHARACAGIAGWTNYIFTSPRTGTKVASR